MRAENAGLRVDNGQVALAITTVTSSGSKGATKTVTAPGFALPHRPQAPITMMATRTASSLGLGSVASVALATSSRVPTVAEEDRLRAALGSELGKGLGMYVERGPQAGTAGLMVLAVVAGLITLAAAIATGLAAADGRADLWPAPPPHTRSRCPG